MTSSSGPNCRARSSRSWRAIARARAAVSASPRRACSATRDGANPLGLTAGGGAETSRRGFAVEVQALWYSALIIGADLARAAGQTARAGDWAALAARAREVLPARFLVRTSRLPGRRRGRKRRGLRAPPASTACDRPAPRAAASRQGAARPGGRAPNPPHARRRAARSPPPTPRTKAPRASRGSAPCPSDQGAGLAVPGRALLRRRSSASTASRRRRRPGDGWTSSPPGWPRAPWPPFPPPSKATSRTGRWARWRPRARWRRSFRLVTRLGRRPSGRSLRPDQRRLIAGDSAACYPPRGGSPVTDGRPHAHRPVSSHRTSGPTPRDAVRATPVRQTRRGG
jgi:hypothetical protein